MRNKDIVGGNYGKERNIQKKQIWNGYHPSKKMNDYIKVINPSVIMMLVALGLIVLGGLVWGFLGTFR